MNQGKETKEIEPQPGLKRFNLNLSLTCNIYKHWHGPVHKVVTACKESTVRQPRASGFCYRASEFCF